jgi:mRNA interferase RelE/StbE
MDPRLLARVQAVIEAVEAASNVGEISNLKKLRGGGDYYRVRVGDYRIGLVVHADQAVFVRCLHRKEIYRYFP